jgi:G:T-mismatch repair DNA endonuclease (very short patch repair protein)
VLATPRLNCSCGEPSGGSASGTDCTPHGFPARPDIVFAGQRIAIFCDGDFWHGRQWVKRRRRLERGSNASYWVAKIRRNIERDRQINRTLRRRGWTVPAIHLLRPLLSRSEALQRLPSRHMRLETDGLSSSSSLWVPREKTVGCCNQGWNGQHRPSEQGRGWAGTLQLTDPQESGQGLKRLSCVQPFHSAEAVAEVVQVRTGLHEQPCPAPRDHTGRTAGC